MARGGLQGKSHDFPRKKGPKNLGSFSFPRKLLGVKRWGSTERVLGGSKLILSSIQWSPNVLLGIYDHKILDFNTRGAFFLSSQPLSSLFVNGSCSEILCPVAACWISE